MKKLLCISAILVCLYSWNVLFAQHSSLKTRLKFTGNYNCTSNTKASQVGKPLFEAVFDKQGADTNWQISAYKINSYYPSGLVESTITQNSSGSNQLKEIYFYNKFGSDTTLIRQNFDSLSSQWQNIYKEVTKRDGHNNITEKSSYFWNGNVWMFIETNYQATYVYNALGFISEKIIKNKNQINVLAFDYKLTRTYNGKNLMLETLYKYNEMLSNWEIKQQWICSYDAQNILTGYIEQHYINGNWRNYENNHNLTFLQNNPIDWGRDTDDYYIYYANKVTRIDISKWDTIANTWVLDNRSTATWDNFNGYTSLNQGYRNNVWVNEYLSYEGYDQFHNWLGFYEKAWQDTSWVWQRCSLNTYTYDASYNVTQRINYQYYNEEDTITESHRKSLYSDFEIFYCAAKFTSNSTTTTVQFNNTSDGNGIFNYWQFGDGETSRLRNPIHVYPNTGFYRVSLSIYNPITDCFDKKDSIIAVGNPYNDCQALFTYVDGGSNQAVFTNISLGIGLNNYLWNFGDGQTSTQQTPTHTYTNGGFYDVCLTVSSTGGCVNTYCRQISINNGGTDFLPYFSYAIDSTGTKAKQAVSYKGAAFGDPAKANYSIDWNFGDGATASSSFNAQHIYDSEGVYLVTLKLTGTNKTRFCVDLINLSSTQTTMKGGFGYLLDTTSKANSYPVSYKGAAFGDPARILWSFGDGSTDSTTMYPTHEYADTGMYNVCLTLSDPITAQSSTNCQQVRVGSLVNIKKHFSTPTQFKIYPNPAKETAFISLNNEQIGLVSIELYDGYGRLQKIIYKSQLGPGSIEIPIKLDDLQTGIYIVKCKTNTKTWINKIFKL